MRGFPASEEGAGERMPQHRPEHVEWMRLALAEASAALATGDVPVGAVVVRGGEVIATGRNERELHEELEIPGSYRQRPVALLNDDSNEVGRVHLGIVHLVEVDSTDVRPREDAIHDPEFLSVAELEARRDRLETWSQICLGGLHRLLAS